MGADNVGSKQMQQIRMSLRGNAVVLMGKNTMMRKAIRGHVQRNAALEKLLPHIKGNVGFVFTRGDLVEIRDKLLENKVRAPARNGAIAPLSVIIPAQNTGLGPEKTSFFQALSIPTKISKGTIEIIVSFFIYPRFRLPMARFRFFFLFFLFCIRIKKKSNWDLFCNVSIFMIF